MRAMRYTYQDLLTAANIPAFSKRLHKAFREWYSYYIANALIASTLHLETPSTKSANPKYVVAPQLSAAQCHLCRLESDLTIGEY